LKNCFLWFKKQGSADPENFFKYLSQIPGIKKAYVWEYSQNGSGCHQLFERRPKREYSAFGTLN